MMEFQLDQEWRLRPIKGDTGKTYIGMRDEDKVFIKRNTTQCLLHYPEKELHQNWYGRNGQEMAIP